MFEIDQAPLQNCLAKNHEVMNANFSSFGVTISLAQYDQTQVVPSIGFAFKSTKFTTKRFILLRESVNLELLLKTTFTRSDSIIR